MLIRWCRSLWSAGSSALRRLFPRQPVQTEPLSAAAALVAIRAAIDQTDRQLFALLRERTRLAECAGVAKAQLGRGIVDLAREQALLDERRAWAIEHDLDIEGVVKLFEAAVLLSRRVQERRHRATEARRKACGR